MGALLYLTSPLVVVIAAWGFWAGGWWVITGAVSFTALAVLDQLLPRDYSAHQLPRPLLWQAVFYLHYPLLMAMWFALGAALGDGRIEGLQVLAAVLSLALLSGGVGLPASHELMHGKSLASRVGADLIGTTVGIPMTELAHVNVHHLHLGTPEDGDTPRRGENVYSFGARSIWAQLTESLKLEAGRLERQGRGLWSPRGRLLWGVAAQAAFAVVFCALAGPLLGVPVLLAGWLLGYLVMADYNYVQHYGLVRVPGAPIEPRHAWNHLKPLSRRLTFEITTNSQHHLDPDRPYHRLEAMPEAPQLPGVWFCFLVSFAPPLWHRMMQGYLAAWDRQHANAAERDLATAANAAAGWA